MSEEAHHPFGPSASEIWINCAAAIKAQAGVADTENEYAAHGTAAHVLADWCLQNDKRPEEYPHKTITLKRRDGGEDWVFPVDEEMIQAVTTYLDIVLDEEGGEHFGERKVYYPDIVEGGFGTSDHVWVNDGHARVDDLKYGKGVQVFAEGNTQLMLYGIGVLREMDFLYDIDRLTLRIIQPRLDHVDEWEISKDDLEEWAEIPRQAAIIAKEPRPPFNPGTHCRWCRVKNVCKARAKWTLDLVPFDQMDVDEDRVLLDPEDLAVIYPHLDDVIAWAKGQKAEVERLLEARQKVGDYKLVRGKRTRAYDDDKSADRALARAGLSAEQRYKTRVLISPVDAEKLLGKKHAFMKDPSKKGGHVEWSKGKPVVAPGDDKRESVIQEISFEDLT